MIIYCKNKRYNVLKENCKKCKEVNFCSTVKDLKAAEKFYGELAEEANESRVEVGYLNYV